MSEAKKAAEISLDINVIQNAQEPSQTNANEPQQLSYIERLSGFYRYHWAGLVLLATPLLLMPLLFVRPALEYRCAFVLLLMTVYWITEAIPLHITSMLPIILFPMFGILNSERTCRMYFSSSLVLFLGSLIIALAIEYSNLHKRLALHAILLVGCNTRKLHFSLLMVTMLISMWISNSVVTSVMCPILHEVLNAMNDQNMLRLIDEKEKNTIHDVPRPSKYVISYYLGLAYAASIGGCATLIGTDTNVAFQEIFERRFQTNAEQELNFINFMLYSLPIMLVCIVLLCIWLQCLHLGLFQPESAAAKQLKMNAENEKPAQNVLRKRLNELGPMTLHELQVGLLFLLLLLLRLTRGPCWFGGWAHFVPNKMIESSMPITIIVLLLFVLPINYKFINKLIKPFDAARQLQETPALLSWHYVRNKLHWSLLLLTGGSLALTEAISTSGLAVLIGNSLHLLQSVPAPLVQFLCICAGTLCTAVASNVAMCTVVMPILMEISLSIHVHPLYLSLPTCLALSMSFLMPISTPPNAIVAAWSGIRSKDMLIAGSAPTVFGIFTIFLSSQTLAYLIFPAYGEFPQWAAHTAQPMT